MSLCFTGAARLQGQQGAKHLTLAARLSRVQMKCKTLILCWVFQGERGDCGAPGEKGDIVGILFNFLLCVMQYTLSLL